MRVIFDLHTVVTALLESTRRFQTFAKNPSISRKCTYFNQKCKCGL